MGIILQLVSRTTPDHSTEVGAQNLARRLRLFWKHRGVEVETWIENAVCKAEGMSVFGVRSRFPNNKIPNT